jgi:hypothetical protein
LGKAATDLRGSARIDFMSVVIPGDSRFLSADALRNDKGGYVFLARGLVFVGTGYLGSLPGFWGPLIILVLPH